MTFDTLRPAFPLLGELPLARTAVDRGNERREAADLLPELWNTPGTKVLLLAKGKAPVRDGALVLVDAADVPRPELAVYLGRTLSGRSSRAASGLGADGAGAAAAADGARQDSEPAGTEVVLVPLSDEPGTLPAALHGADWLGLRDVAAGLSARDAGLFVEAVSIANWHATHTHCPRCGAATVPVTSGWVRLCPADQSQHFPRTDPAIIVTVVDEDDRLLLGAGAQWGGGRYSTLAGFVEPGESLEAAVIREVEEESALTVKEPQYLGSQPWPFPCSLMLGFTATAVNPGAAKADGVEILDVRWFTRSELAEAVEKGEVTIAGGVSIARALIEHWYGGALPEPRVLVN